MAKRLIDSAELIAKLPVVDEDKQISLIGAVADVMVMISECQTVDAVEVSVLEKWLYEIAWNNTRNPLCDSCEEIIRRLPGLRKFAEEYGGQAPQREDV